MTFTKWLETFIEEKGLNTDTILEVEGPSGANFIPAEIVFDAMKSAPAHEQASIKTMIVKIDFVNGDVMDFVKHLAGALAL